MFKSGENHHNWKGGINYNQGRVIILIPGHRRANSKGYVRRSVLVAEKVLGKPLPDRAVVHHVNGDPSDDAPNNLVICQDRSYHILLHQRMRALKLSGHANWRVCVYCARYDDPINMNNSLRSFYHKECLRLYSKAYRKLKKFDKK